MKKLSLLCLFVSSIIASHAQIKVHDTGHISLQSLATTEGIQFSTNGFTSFEPNMTNSGCRIVQTLAKNTLSKCWIVKNDLNVYPTHGDVFYVTGVGNSYGYNYYTFSHTPSRSEELVLIENATALIMNLNGYYIENHEFDGVDNDFEGNDNVMPEAIQGLLYDMEKDKCIGMLAEELEEVIPESVRHDVEGKLYINYNALVPVLIEAVKEQQKEIESLKTILKENGLLK